MGFLTSKRLSQPVDRPLHRTKASLKKCNLSNRPEESRLTVPRKKISSTFCESEMEDIDIEMQLNLAEGMSDESNCMWLSSDCDCSSLLGSDLSDLCQLDGWNHSFIDSPLIKSVKPDSAGHDLQIDPSGELSKGLGVLNDKSVCCCESTYDRFLEDLWRYESSCSSLSIIDDLDRTRTWISTHDLNLESSELIQLKDGVNSTSLGFSSSSCSYSSNPQSESSFSSPSSTTTYHLTEASRSVSSEFDHNEPLFWPYNQNLYESFELGKSFLCISPRKEKKMAGNKIVNQLKSVETKLKKTDSLSGRRKSMQLQCGRRPESSLTPKKSSTGWKSVAPTGKNYNNSQCPPLQLNASLAQASAKLPPCNSLTKKKINSTMKETPQLKSVNRRNKLKELPEKSLLEFEASFFHEVLIEGGTIEKLIGLNEFDADEWLNFKFNEDCFAESRKKEESSKAGRETFFLQLLETTL